MRYLAAAILAASIILAFADLFASRWEITSSAAGNIVRLDRWSGTVTSCGTAYMNTVNGTVLTCEGK